MRRRNLNPRRAFFAGLAALATLSAAHAVVIGFDNIISAPNDPYSGHTEKGFEVTPVLGYWQYNPYDGDPFPDIIASFFNSTITVSLNIQRSNGGLFSLNSAWFYFESYGSYSFDGYRNGEQAFHLTRDFADAFGTRTCPYSAQIDTVKITMFQAHGYIRQIDSINVTPAPEPAAATVLVIAAGCLALRRRPGEGI